MKIAALQMVSEPDVRANLDQAMALLRQAREQGAEGPAAPQAVVVRQLHGMAQQADVFLFLHGDGWAIGS